MKLATTTSDFSKYVTDTYEAIKYVNDSGFKYIDYGFSKDFSCGNGIFSADYNGYIKSIKELADKRDIKFVQAHSPMGAPLIYDENHKDFIEGTKKCISACGELGIDNIVVQELSEVEMTDCAIRYIYTNLNRFRQIVKVINKAEIIAKANGLNSIDETLIKEAIANETENIETNQES